jgi:PAS domain S-box-containing protein
MKGFSLRSPITLATAFSVLALVLAFVTLSRGIRAEADSWRWVAHTREVLQQIQVTHTLTSEAESAQRGFLLTNNESFATAFSQARADLVREVRLLGAISSDNPQQRRLLPELEALLNQRMLLLERVLARARAGVAPDAATLEEGRQIKQRILAQARAMRDEEERLLALRQEAAEQARRELVLAIGLAAGLAIFLVVLLWLLSYRYTVRLRFGQARLDATLRSIGDGVIAADAQGRVRLLNPVAQELTGLTERAAHGKALDELLKLRSDAGAALTPAAAQAAAAPPILRAADGREFAVELSMRPIALPDGPAEGTVVVLRDVSERTARQRALAESEANYRHTIELNPQMPWKAGPDGAIVDVSERLVVLTGKPRAALLGEGWAAVTDPADLAGMQAAWKRALASARSYDVEHRIRTAHGETRWMRSRASPRRGADGAVIAWYGLTEDIHARKKAELALVTREAELRDRLVQIDTISRAVPVCLGYMAPDGRLLEMNEALAQFLGPGAAAGIGRPLAEHLPGPLAGPLALAMQRVRRERRPVADLAFSTGVAPTPRRDWVGGFYPAIEHGELRGVVLALLDVSPLKAAQRELEEANLLLERRIEERTARLADANAELRAFAHTVAHDLRAPLRNLEGFASALLEDESERMSEDGRMFAGRIVAAATRMDLLITDLLAYSRLARAEVRLERVELASVMQAVLRDLESAIAAAGARVEVAPGLPAVRGNAAILVQVLANLVGNAIKFVAPGVTPVVAVGAARAQHTVELWIEDNGIGIAPEHHEQVFGVFERLHGQEEYPGTGIGLAIVRKGVERMGGGVAIKPGARGGARFELRLPAADI